MDQLDYDDDDFYAGERPDEGRGAVKWGVWMAVLAAIAGFLSCSARGQDFANVAGAVPVQIERTVGMTVDPLEVLVRQSVDWLCGYIAILSSARSTPSSPVHVVGQKRMKCVEDTTPIPPSPGSTLPPTPASGWVSYAAGVVTVEVAPQFTRVELLIDGRTSSPWYRGSRKVADGKAVFVLPPEALDGKEHALDVRLYTEAMDRPHRPDNYPVRVVLTP